MKTTGKNPPDTHDVATKTMPESSSPGAPQRPYPRWLGALTAILLVTCLASGTVSLFTHERAVERLAGALGGEALIGLVATLVIALIYRLHRF